MQPRALRRIFITTARPQNIGEAVQARDVLTTASKVSEDADTYLQRIQSIPVEELARRFDYKSKVAVEELLTLSAFMKKALLYLCGIATLSLYLNVMMKQD